MRNFFIATVLCVLCASASGCYMAPYEVDGECAEACDSYSFDVVLPPPGHDHDICRGQAFDPPASVDVTVCAGTTGPVADVNQYFDATREITVTETAFFYLDDTYRPQSATLLVLTSDGYECEYKLHYVD